MYSVCQGMNLGVLVILIVAPLCNCSKAYTFLGGLPIRGILYESAPTMKLLSSLSAFLKNKSSLIKPFKLCH
jgi:hypothetical protein